MLTLPLLRVFLNKSIIAFRLDGSIIRYFTFNGEHQTEHQINIYEFMYNCKVLAWESTGIVIMSSIAALDDPLIERKARCILTYWNLDKPVVKYFDHTYEFYAVLQTCRFILDNKLLKVTHDTSAD